MCLNGLSLWEQNSGTTPVKHPELPLLGQDAKAHSFEYPRQTQENISGDTSGLDPTGGNHGLLLVAAGGNHGLLLAAPGRNCGLTWDQEGWSPRV